MTSLLEKNVIGIIKKYNSEKQKIIFMIHDIQKMSGKNCINEESAKILCNNLGISLSKIYDIITFYSMFENEPRGRYIIEICNSGPCFARNYEKVASVFEEILGIKVGQTTKDGLFTLQYTSCIGACDIAPAVKIGEEVYGNLDREKIIRIIDQYRGGTLCQK